MAQASVSGLEGFVEAARRVVEAEAAAHTDDRWWVLEPLLLTERGGDVRATELRSSRAALRALGATGPAALPEALGVRRAAVVLHVDLADGDDIASALVLLAVTPLLEAVQVAHVQRTDAGTPRLGPWTAGTLDEDEVAAALRRLALGD